MPSRREPMPSEQSHPYRELPEDPPLRRRFSWTAFAAFSWVALGSVGMMLTSHHQPFQGRFELFFALGLATLLGVALAIYALVQLGTYAKPERPYGFGLAVAALPLGTFLAWIGSVMVHTAAYVPSYMGRRHRKGSTLYAPRSEAGEAWLLADESSFELPSAVRGPLGAEWRDNARKEHASVAAFSQLALDLMAVGAPPHLVVAAHEDALDEIRHAATCFAIARDIDGLAESPSAFPEARVQKRLFTASRPVALVQIAIDALADGVLNEGIASRLLAQLAKKCELPSMASALRTMAADESRHAAHSWDIVAWCLEAGGEIVAQALEGAVSGMPKAVCCALPEGARSGAWDRWGVQGLSMEEAAFAKTREHARVKLAALLHDHAALRLRRRAPITDIAPSTPASAAGTSAANDMTV